MGIGGRGEWTDKADTRVEVVVGAGQRTGIWHEKRRVKKTSIFKFGSGHDPWLRTRRILLAPVRLPEGWRWPCAPRNRREFHVFHRRRGKGDFTAFHRPFIGDTAGKE